MDLIIDRKLRPSVACALAVAMLAAAAGPAAAQETTPGAAADTTWPRLTTGLVYGEDDDFRQVINVLEPEPRTTPRPAVALFHGGGLVVGTPLQDLVQAQRLADQGFVTFLVGYRLFDENTGVNPWPTQLHDAQRAIRWIRGHVDEFRIDPDRLCAVGYSSGGQLAGLLGTTDSRDSERPEDSVSSRVDCVATVAGPVDLLVPQGDQYMRLVLDRLLGGTVEELPDAWRDASPAHLVDEQTVPFLVIHGSRDVTAPPQGSRNLAMALDKAGIEHTYAEIDADHFDVWTSDETATLIDAFLADQLRASD